MKCMIASFLLVMMTCTFARATEPGPFDKGTWSLTLSGAHVTPIRYSDNRLYQVTVAGGYHLWDNHSFNVELQGFYGEQPDAHDVIIGGIGILGRLHLLHFDRWSVFFDGGGGVIYADRNFPPAGTNFNFVGKLGFGATYALRERSYLIGGARYFHVSNGMIRGVDENPGYDGIEIWAGMMWTW